MFWMNRNTLVLDWFYFAWIAYKLKWIGWHFSSRRQICLLNNLVCLILRLTIICVPDLEVHFYKIIIFLSKSYIGGVPMLMCVLRLLSCPFFPISWCSFCKKYVSYILFDICFKTGRRCSLCVISSSLIYSRSIYEYLKYPLFIKTAVWFVMDLGFQ